jgi:hypothetical protein
MRLRLGDVSAGPEVLPVVRYSPKADNRRGGRYIRLMLPGLREHPYLIHTNRELGLMLKGTKPLAMFADGEDYFPEAVLRYLRMFDRHVESGRFTRRDMVAVDSKGSGFATSILPSAAKRGASRP